MLVARGEKFPLELVSVGPQREKLETVHGGNQLCPRKSMWMCLRTLDVLAEEGTAIYYCMSLNHLPHADKHYEDNMVATGGTGTFARTGPSPSLPVLVNKATPPLRMSASFSSGYSSFSTSSSAPSAKEAYSTEKNSLNPPDSGFISILSKEIHMCTTTKEVPTLANGTCIMCCQHSPMWFYSYTYRFIQSIHRHCEGYFYL